jgi:hypothetical protein
VTVGGVFTAAGTLSFVSKATNFVPAGGTQYPVVTAASSTGTFANTTFAAGLLLSGTLTYTSTGVTANFNPISASSVGGLTAMSAGIDAAVVAATNNPGTGLDIEVGGLQTAKTLDEVKGRASNLIGLDWANTLRNQQWLAVMHEDPASRVAIAGMKGWSYGFAGTTQSPGLSLTKQSQWWSNRVAVGYLSSQRFNGRWNQADTNTGAWSRIESALQPSWSNGRAWATLAVGAAWQQGLNGELRGDFYGQTYNAPLQGMDGVAPFTRMTMGVRGQRWSTGVYFESERRNNQTAEQAGLSVRGVW